jgi:hypothetical protein
MLYPTSTIGREQEFCATIVPASVAEVSATTPVPTTGAGPFTLLSTTVESSMVMSVWL